MEFTLSTDEKYFFARVNGKYIKINFDDILYIEGCKNYVKIFTDQKTFYVLLTMKEIDLALSKKGFLRIHKSYIVSFCKVTEFNSSSVSINTILLPLGGRFKERFEKAVPFLLK